MSKKTSTIITLTIMTILTAYISSLIFSNQVYAQPVGGSTLNELPVIDSLTGGLLDQSGGTMQHFKPSDLAKELLADLKAQLGEVLGGNSLGDVCLSCWGG
jgi:hypothetical protein